MRENGPRFAVGKLSCPCWFVDWLVQGSVSVCVCLSVSVCLSVCLLEVGEGRGQSVWLATVTVSASCWPGKKKVLGSQWRPVLPDPGWVWGWDGSSLLSHFQTVFLPFCLFCLSPAVISLVVSRHLQPLTLPVLLHFPALTGPHSLGAHPSALQSSRWNALVSLPLPRTFCVLWKMSHMLKNTYRKGQLPYPKPGTPPLLFWKADFQGEQPAVFPGGDRNWEWLGEAAERGPDAAPAEGKPGAWSSGWQAHLPCSMPSPQPHPGPSHPEASPRPRSRCLRAWLSWIQHEVPSLPPVRNSVLWPCLLLVCQIALLMLSAMSDQSANNTTGWNLNKADAQIQGYVDWTSKGRQR